MFYYCPGCCTVFYQFNDDYPCPHCKHPVESLDVAKIIAAQHHMQPTAAGGSDSGENSESGGG